MTKVIDFSKKLTQLKDELSERVSKIDSDLSSQRGGEVVRQDDHNYDVSREEVLLALKNEAQEELNLIDAAISRIKNGTYGKCTVCGGEIEANRLSAVPYASSCVECAREAKSK